MKLTQSNEKGIKYYFIAWDNNFAYYEQLSQQRQDLILNFLKFLCTFQH